MMCSSSSAVLFVILFVQWAAGRGCTRERRWMVGRSIHDLVGCELFIVVIATLAAVWDLVGRCGCCGGYIYIYIHIYILCI